MGYSTWQMLMAFIMTMAFGMSPALAQHMKKDGTPDMRYKENRESSSSYSAPSYSAPRETEHVKNDGTPDMRYKENRSIFAPRMEDKPAPIIPAAPRESAHLKNDGTPDMRYRENRDSSPAPVVNNNSGVRRYGNDSNNNSSSDRLSTSTPRSRWETDSNGRYVDPKTGRSLNNDGSYDMRHSENKDLKGAVSDSRTGRPATSTPKSQWITGANGRYIDPKTGRSLNNNGTFDMRHVENKDLTNVGARVRIGADNSAAANQRQSRVRTNNRIVINNYYTSIHNTYIYGDVVYGSYGWQNSYYGGIVWGAPVTYCSYGCDWYTPTYWDVLYNDYNYRPSYYYTYRPVVLSDADLAFGLVSWLFVNNAYEQGRADQAYLDDQDQQFYRDSLQISRPVRAFRYSQAFLPTEDFVELAKDVSGADQNTIENFMDGLQNMTSILEQRIRVRSNNPNFTIQKNDIDVRLAENHGNLLVVLKGHIDRRNQDGTSYAARIDFTATIDLRTSAVKLFGMSDHETQPSVEEAANLRDINLQISETDTRIEPAAQDDDSQPVYRSEPSPSSRGNW